MFLFRLLGRLFLFLAVVIAAAGTYAWLQGKIMEVAGRAWIDLHPYSLNYLQVIVQRHLGLNEFWFEQIQPTLARPTWEVALGGVIACLVLAGLLLFIGRKRKHKGPFD